jgi:hypothetical protein
MSTRESFNEYVEVIRKGLSESKRSDVDQYKMAIIMCAQMKVFIDQCGLEDKLMIFLDELNKHIKQ